MSRHPLAAAGSELIADAHVVAVCAGADAAVVVTSDPDAITALAVTVPGTRILVRRPDLGLRSRG